MTPIESPNLTQTDHQEEHENAKQLSCRRQIIKADWRKRKSLQRQYWRDQKLKGENSMIWVMAPKWRSHQDEHFKPHLFEHKHELVAPRYCGNAICQQLRPGDEFGCSCNYCRPRYPSRTQQERWEIELALRKTPMGSRSARTRVGNAGKEPWVYWDWIGYDGLCIPSGKEDYLLEYQDHECAPEAILDLLGISKPAKRREKALPVPGRSSPSPSLVLGQTAKEPATADYSIPSDIDHISILGLEETWEHLSFDFPLKGEGDSESEWERVSQF